MSETLFRSARFRLVTLGPDSFATVKRKGRRVHIFLSQQVHGKSTPAVTVLDIPSEDFLAVSEAVQELHVEREKERG